MLSLAETITNFKNSSLSYITRLDLSHCSRAGRLPTLNVKGLRSSGGVAVGKCVDGWKNLEELMLDYNKIGKIGSTEVARGLRNALKVNRVSMRACYIGAVGAEAFGEVRRSEERLKSYLLVPPLEMRPLTYRRYNSYP